MPPPVRRFRLGQRFAFRIDELQAGAVVEIADLQFVIAFRQFRIATPNASQSLLLRDL